MLLYVFKCVQMCSFVFKLVQNLFKCVQMWPNLFKTRSNVLKCVQTCSELVQMCSFHIRSNLFKTFSNVMSSRLCLVVFCLPLLTFSVLILLFTLINHIHHVSHINYFNYVNQITNFVLRSLNGNQIKEKEGGRTIHPPLTHHPPQGRILTTFRLFLLQGADNEGGFWLISAFFLLQGAGD